MTQDELPCWKIVLNKDGSIRSAEISELLGGDGTYTRYVYAVDKAAACAEALSWYERTLKARKEHICIICFQPTVSGSSKCLRCKYDGHKPRNQTGQVVKTRAAVYNKKYRQYSSISDSTYVRKCRKKELKEALQFFDTHEPHEFRKWLVARIMRLEPVREAVAAE